MTREEVYQACLDGLGKSDFLLLEAATGLGKSKISIDLVNHLAASRYKEKPVTMLLLVAKKVHKQTWQDEMAKWGGIHVDSLTIECYESLRKHEHESFDIILMDEVHHIGSDRRLDSLKTLHYGHAIGLSATIPRKLKDYFRYEYHARIVSCDLVEAIESNVLPQPQIILLPLSLDNARPTEQIEVNPKARGKTYHGTFSQLWSYRKMKVHAVVSCTQRQKVNDYNSQIEYEKKRYMLTRQEFLRKKWLLDCGERLKYLANLKNNLVCSILCKLEKERTITFCKTIEQAEFLGQYAVHSKNKDSDALYRQFNDKRINHITSVNILNENANLVDCRYAVFANYSSSEVCSAQRVGRALRHPSPVIIMPYYENTREEEIVREMLQDFDRKFIHILRSVGDLDKYT